MDELTVAKTTIEKHRQVAFGLLPGQRLQDAEQAVEFVNARGFVYFWPIKGIDLPSLWVAAAGDRPVADAHDDPGHVTWGWKDGLLGKRRWHYGKVLRKRATMISLEVLPYFYALSENYGDPAEDHLILYEQGRLSQEAKAIYDALLDEGALDTLALRKAARMSSAESNSRFERALSELQADFKIMPVGVAPVGAWRYAFIYEIVARHYPDLIDRTRFISNEQAYQKLSLLYLEMLGAAQTSDLVKLFGWKSAAVQAALAALAVQGQVRLDYQAEGQPGNFAVLEKLTKNENSTDI